MQIGDLGHGAANHPLDTARLDRQGNRFLDAWLLRRGKPPRPGKVTALTQTCPRDAPAGGAPFIARDFGSLARGEKVFGTRKRLRITSGARARHSRPRSTRSAATSASRSAKTRRAEPPSPRAPAA